jgi:hypothetical protein
MITLTSTQRTYLRAAVECDSITNDRLRLQVLNKLRDMDLLDIFDMEPSWNKNSHKIIYHFEITPAGRAALEGQAKL